MSWEAGFISTGQVTTVVLQDIIQAMNHCHVREIAFTVKTWVDPRTPGVPTYNLKRD